MWVFDTAALVRLTFFCVTGGCGVSPMWVAIGGGAIVLAMLVSLRRPRADVKRADVKRADVKRADVKRVDVKRADVKKAGVTKAGASRPARRKAAVPRKPKPAK
jgi:hypothetical protein